MALLKQSTARSRVILMVDSSDHVTGKTGLTLTITASKDGGAFASISPTVTELATGWYKLALTTSHTDTLGDLALHVTSTGADPTDIADQVVLDLPGVAQTGDSYARIGAAGAGLTALGDTRIAHLDADVSSRSTFAGGAVASVTGAVGSVTGLTASDVGAIKSKTDQFVFTVANQVDANALSGGGGLDAAGVRAAVGLASANLDTQLDGLPTAAENAVAVVDQTLSGHTGAGTVGGGINAAGSAGDPWSTALPGAYGAGTAGKIIGDNINATISSRSTIAAGAAMTLTSAYDAAKTAAQSSDVPSAAANASATATQITTDHGAGSYIRNTEPVDVSVNVTAIKAKTDNLPANPAAATSVMSANVTKVNGVTVAGTGTTIDPWGPA